MCHDATRLVTLAHGPRLFFLPFLLLFHPYVGPRGCADRPLTCTSPMDPPPADPLPEADLQSTRILFKLVYPILFTPA